MIGPAAVFAGRFGQAVRPAALLFQDAALLPVFALLFLAAIRRGAASPGAAKAAVSGPVLLAGPAPAAAGPAWYFPA